MCTSNSFFIHDIVLCAAERCPGDVVLGHVARPRDTDAQGPQEVAQVEQPSYRTARGGSLPSFRANHMWRW